jgi:hypothetical protein
MFGLVPGGYVPVDDESPATSPARQRLDEDDHDLLTFSEAGERLRLEVAAAAARVAELESRADGGELDRARNRLDALRAAAQRNSVQPLNDANFEKFFGYPGKARRNLSGPGAD